MPSISEFKLNPLDGSTEVEYSDGTIKKGSIVPAADLTAADVARVRAGLPPVPLAPLSNSAVAITTNTGATTSTIASGATTHAWNSGRFTYPGGDYIVAGAAYPDYSVCKPANITSSQQVQRGVVEFVFAGQAFEVFGKQTAIAPNCRIRVIADGEIVNAGRYVTTTTASGVLLYMLFDFGAFVNKRIRVEFGYFYFGGIRALDTASVLPVDISRAPLMIGIGDSFEEGTGANFPHDAAWANAARQLGIVRYWSSGVGSTGYLANGGGGGKTTYRGRIANDVIRYAPEIVGVYGSTNDLAFTPGQIGAEASALYAELKSGIPGVLLIVTGICSVQTPTAAVIAANAAIKSAALEAGAMFIDPVGDPLPWITGSGKVDATTGNGNADWATDTDRGHPTFAGHQHMARRIVQAAKRWL